MQVLADKPIDDEESIRRALRGPLRGISVPRDSGEWGTVIDHEALRTTIRRYNDTSDYADLVLNVYYTLNDRNEPPR